MKNLVIFCAIILLSISAAAQQPVTGIQPFGSYGGGTFDRINLGNLNVTLAIPIVNKPGRGVPFTFALGYDSSVWTPTNSGSMKVWQPIAGWGWRGVPLSNQDWHGVAGPAVGYVEVTEETAYCINMVEPPSGRGPDYEAELVLPYTVYHYGQFYDRFGVLRYIGTSTWAMPENCYNSTNQLEASGQLTDSSGLRYSVSQYHVTITEPSGNVYTPDMSNLITAFFTDINGNQITTTGPSFVDTLGEPVLSVSGNGTEASPMVYQFNIPGRTDRVSAEVSYKKYRVQTFFQCGGVSEYNLDADLVDTVTLPDQRMYRFTYEDTPQNSPSFVAGAVTGRLASITLPTGGVISYSYSGDHYGIDCSDGTATVLARTTDDGTWQYTRSQVAGTTTNWKTEVVDPSASTTTLNFQTTLFANKYFLETKRDVAGLLTVDTCYNNATPDCTGTPVFFPITNKSVQQTYPGTTGNVSKTLTSYDGNGQVTGIAEYDFGHGTSGSLIRNTSITYAQLDGKILDRPANVNVNGVVTQFGYDESAVLPSGAPQHVAVFGRRGNLTSKTVGGVTSRYTYYDTGSMRSSTDPGGHTTTLDYDPTNTFVKQTTYPATNGVNHITKANYDPASGALTSTTDFNDNVTTYGYDPYGRLNSIVTGSPVAFKTEYLYTDSRTVESHVFRTASDYITRIQVFDSYGRPSISGIKTGDNWSRVDTCANANMNTVFVSNPYVSDAPSSGSALSCSVDGDTITYDALGRATLIKHADGNTIALTYAAGCTTMPDEVGNTTTSCVNGIGNIKNVTDAAEAMTSYSYDGQGNLTGVVQNQSRQRAFTYNSLGRMTSETNPETGTIGYHYDSCGNLDQKTAPAPNAGSGTITTTYNYDALHRITYKHTSDNSVNADYYYDESSSWGATLYNTKGRLSSTCYNGNVCSLMSYDVMGRNTVQWHTRPGVSMFSLSANYNLDGSLASLRYPSGRLVKNIYDDAGRLSSVNFASMNGQPVNYAYYKVSSYWPNGQPSGAVFGNGLGETTSQNSRLQATEFKLAGSGPTTLMDLKPCMYNTGLVGDTCGTGGENNGNVWAIQDALNTDRNQLFTYDSLNRLSNAKEFASSGFGQKFTIDSWGNLTNIAKVDGHTSPTPDLNCPADATNRLSCYSYDGAGNQLSNGVNSFHYNGENRIDWMDGGAATYTYDSSGKRVLKTASGKTTSYIHFGTQVIAEQDVATGDWTDYVYAGSKRVALGKTTEYALHISGTKCATCGWEYANFTMSLTSAITNRTIQQGDKLYLKQYQPSGSHGGMNISFAEGGWTTWQARDGEGYWLNDDQVQDSVHLRVVDLSAFAGKHISHIDFASDGDTANGPWHIVFSDVMLIGADGSIIPIYDSSSPAMPSLSASGTSGQTDLSATIDTYTDREPYPQNVTWYYHGDHLGSARMRTNGYGYPVWQGTYTPFGYEVNAQSAPNRYKFAEMEKDEESGQYHTWFRQYSPNAGRWLTPDPAGLAAVDLLNPQSWNRYAYVINSPLKWIDPYGLNVKAPEGTQHRGGDFGFGNCNMNGFLIDCAMAFGPTGDWAAPCPDNNCQGLEYTADNIIWGWIANTDSSWQIIVHSPSGSGYGNVLAYWGEVGRWNGFLKLYARSFRNANESFEASYGPQYPVVKGPAPKPSPQTIKAICTIDALNANNGLGLPAPSVTPSGSESVFNGIVFQQSTQHGIRTMNPSSPNITVMGPPAAPGIFVQNSYVNCLEHF